MECKICYFNPEGKVPFVIPSDGYCGLSCRIIGYRRGDIHALDGQEDVIEQIGLKSQQEGRTA